MNNIAYRKLLPFQIRMNVHDLWSKIGFFPSLLYVFLADRAGIENYYTIIDNSVILGALPTHSVLKTVFIYL